MEYDIIRAKIFRSNKKFIQQRIARIAEAISFASGTIENPKKSLISSLPNGKEAYFLKPGKETLRKKTNMYDMVPSVGENEISETENWGFDKLWEYLIKISIINQITFKKVLVIIYRNCFLIDHHTLEKNKLRYLPSSDLLSYIDKIEFSLRDGFMDKFGTKEIGLIEYLYFLDLLGWNEDIKYHVVDGHPDFERHDQKVGRINTMISVISASLMISKFILDVINKTEKKGIIDVKLITSTIQMFSKSRGICVLPNKDLSKELNPYLEN